jgi:hypothetical protein
MNNQEKLTHSLDHIQKMGMRHQKLATLCKDILTMCDRGDGQYKQYETMPEAHYEAVLSVALTLSNITIDK